MRTGEGGVTDAEMRDVDECFFSPALFVERHCQIYDATDRVWMPFALWPAQRETLRTMHDNRLTVILKARQLGLTWLVLAYALWLMLFRPAATVLLFSKRDDEAMYLLGDERLRGMWRRLPEHVRSGHGVESDNAHEWMLSNGSIARAFPTTAGDSYTATLAIVDEADLAQNLNSLMRAVKPTIDGGGRMILLSRTDKSRPNSEFKAIYRAARKGLNGWAPVFLPWYVRPARDAAWYEAQRVDIVSRTGSEDDLHEQYPATDGQALAPRSLDKRIAAAWLEQCYEELEPLADLPAGAPAIPGLVVYRLPAEGLRYVIGADPAEGNPTSDDSALCVLEAATGEEVASLAGKFEPSVLAGYADRIGRWYNHAALMVERNNHGHAVLLWLRDHSGLQRVSGFDGREGWHSTSQGKALLYNETADAFRDQATILHSFDTWTQLASINGSTLRAPEGEHDDRADAYALAQTGRRYAGGSGIFV